MFSTQISNLTAFGAGLASFFSPCVFPLIPAFFAFIASASIEELQGKKTFWRRWEVILTTLLFVLGFSAVFVAMGAMASYLGGLIVVYKDWIRIIGGILILIFGLQLLGWSPFKMLHMEKRIHLNQNPIHIWGAFLIGMAFAAGWTPCIGPVLGSLLTMAGMEGSMREGMILLGFYAAGLGIPFLIFAILIDYTFCLLQKSRSIMKYLNRVMGLLLVVVGILLIANWLRLFVAI